jgi:hypothetical protein
MDDQPSFDPFFTAELYEQTLEDLLEYFAYAASFDPEAV